jgi:YggT family protein
MALRTLPDEQLKGRDMTSIFQILLMIIGVARFMIFAHFIMSWLISFQVLNVRQPLVAQVWYGLERLLDPIYRPLRNFLPRMGGLDLSPIVALLGLEAIRIILINNIAMFY